MFWSGGSVSSPIDEDRRQGSERGGWALGAGDNQNAPPPAQLSPRARCLPRSYRPGPSTRPVNPPAASCCCPGSVAAGPRVLSGFLAADALCALPGKGAAQGQHKLVAGLGRVGGGLVRLHHDRWALFTCAERMVAEDDVGGHHLGDARDGHRLAGTRARQDADAADAGGRDSRCWPRDGAQRPVAERDRAGLSCSRPWRRCGHLHHGDDASTNQGRHDRHDCPAGVAAAEVTALLATWPLAGRASPAAGWSPGRPAEGPGRCGVHTGEDSAPVSPLCPVAVTAVSQTPGRLRAALGAAGVTGRAA